MNNQIKKWVVLAKTSASKAEIGDIVDILLQNREIKSRKEKLQFINPKFPEKISLREFGIKKKEIDKTIVRLKKSLRKKEKVIIYGDYDADGICATAILWESLYVAGLDVLPYIPERFSEGYGINTQSVEKLQSEYPNLGLIITVDNGIVANEAVSEIRKKGIEIIITDHHQKGQSLPKAFSIVHTDKIGGAEIAWVLAREVLKSLKIKDEKLRFGNGLDITAIGTIADQIPLTGPNRSFAKYGLEILNVTQRPGLLALFKEARLNLKTIGSYEIGYIIAPRINAMGRLKHAIDSLRLLCVKSPDTAADLANILGKTNQERQKIVDLVIIQARERVAKNVSKKVFILADESYHEGVIGLAAGKLAEEFYKPAIVISKGKEISKASARSISGFNIIEAIRQLEDILKGAGGHPMAAGFSLATKDIEIFSKRFEEISRTLLTEEILIKKLKIDLEIRFDNLNLELAEALAEFEPTGLGNPAPLFMTKRVTLIEAKTVGQDGKHLKLVLGQGKSVFEAIAFNFGNRLAELSPRAKVDIVYSIEKNVWNNRENLQLKIKDLRIEN